MDRALEKQLVMAWVRGCEEIEAMRRRELEAMTDDDVRSHVEAIFTGPYPFDVPPRKGSGLAEQQRRFAKLRRGG